MTEEDWEYTGKSLSPGDFARTTLSPGTVASRYVGKTSQDHLVLADYETRSIVCGYGGWEKYDRAEINSEVPLKNGSYQGRRVGSMCRQELNIVGDRAVAFVTDYSGDSLSIRQAHSQMAVWAFCDSLGLNVPRHHWFPDKEIVVVEGVGEVNQAARDPISVNSEAVNRINSEHLLEYISVLLIAGNADLRPPNFKIGEEGQIYTFDFDKSDQYFKSASALRVACTKALTTIKALDEVRDVPLEIDRSEICSRVEKIATQIQCSQHMDRILGTIELYDKIFKEKTGVSFKNQVGNNISVFSTTD